MSVDIQKYVFEALELMGISKEQYLERLEQVSKTITCKRAAELLGTTAVDVAWKLRNGEVPYGCAVKKGGRYKYIIYESQVLEYKKGVQR